MRWQQAEVEVLCISHDAPWWVGLFTQAWTIFSALELLTAALWGHTQELMKDDCIVFLQRIFLLERRLKFTRELCSFLQLVWWKTGWGVFSGFLLVLRNKSATRVYFFFCLLVPSQMSVVLFERFSVCHTILLTLFVRFMLSGASEQFCSSIRMEASVCSEGILCRSNICRTCRLCFTLSCFPGKHSYCGTAAELPQFESSRQVKF